MLKVRENIALPQSASQSLAALQAKVDGEPDYPARVAAARAAWDGARKNDPPFDAMKSALIAMCWGRRRCMYCEDSSADEIEHLWPKSLYPERVFDWENHLFACGPCNGPKGSAFAVFPAGSDTPVEVARKKGQPVVPPLAGDAVLLDPRRDDPLEFLTLSIALPVDQGGYRFVERPARGTRAWERAHYTIKTLRLNDRSDVVEGREDAYRSLCRVLRDVPRLRAKGESLEGERRSVRNTPHRSVWEGMKRQRDRIAELRQLFAMTGPVVLDW